VTPDPGDAIALVILMMAALVCLIIAGPDRVADFLGEAFDALGVAFGRLGRGIRRVVITTARRVRARFRPQPEVRKTVAYAEPAVRRVFFPHVVPSGMSWDNDDGSATLEFSASSVHPDEPGMSMIVVQDVRKGDVVGTTGTRVMFAPEGTAADAPLDEWGVAGYASSVEVETTHHEPAYLEWGDPGPRPWASSVTVDLPELSPELLAWFHGSPTLDEASPDQPEARERQTSSFVKAYDIHAASRRSFDAMQQLWTFGSDWRAYLEPKPEPKPLPYPSLWEVAPLEPIHHVTKEATVPKNKPTRKQLKQDLASAHLSFDNLRRETGQREMRVQLAHERQIEELGKQLKDEAGRRRDEQVRAHLHRQQLERELSERDAKLEQIAAIAGPPVAFHERFGPNVAEQFQLAVGKLTLIRFSLGLGDAPIDYRGHDANG
jgi:hypothetical protein